MIIIKNKTFRRLLPLMMTLCCAVAIFLFSVQNGNQSKELSNGLLSYILAFRRGIPIEEITYEDLKKYGYIIRKIAHLTVFFILGAFSCWSARTLLQKKCTLISLSFCTLYACFDEIHQFFSDGRSPSYRDVLIDSTGAFIGIMLTNFIFFCIGRGKNHSCTN